MNEDFVTYEQAEKLYDLGFDLKCIACYNEGEFEYTGEYNNYNSGYYRYNIISAPTLTQAQKWLREVKKEHLIVNIDRWVTATPYRFEIYQETGEVLIHQYTQNDFSTYEEALMARISKLIEILK